jgi:hypothetical protein
MTAGTGVFKGVLDSLAHRIPDPGLGGKRGGGSGPILVGSCQKKAGGFQVHRQGMQHFGEPLRLPDGLEHELQVAGLFGFAQH